MMIVNDGRLGPINILLVKDHPCGNPPLPTIMLLLVDNAGTVALHVYNSHLGHFDKLLMNNGKLDRPLGNHPLHNVVRLILNDATLCPVILVFPNDPC